MITVLANGCFDILHPGHLAHLREARAMGHRLIVALTADECVNKGKDRPFHKWVDRAALLRELRCVDAVIPTVSSVAAIRLVRPTIFVKGIDYVKGDRFTEDIAGACAEVGADLRFTRAPKQSIAETLRRVAA